MSNQKGNGLNYRSWVEVDLDNFTHNWSEMRRLVGPDVKILSVVKADAYGHGAIEISNVALKNGACCLGVANADEGVQLRVGGIDAPILILSPSMGLEIDEIIKYNLTPSVSDLGFARELQKKAEKSAGQDAHPHRGGHGHGPRRHDPQRGLPDDRGGPRVSEPRRRGHLHAPLLERGRGG